MKIAVCILSRNHPEALTGVIMGLWRLRTTDHHVDFHIGLDEDDQRSRLHAADLGITLGGEIPPENLCIHLGQRSPTRGEVENRLLEACRDADCVTFLTDRTFCITPAWDEYLARGVKEQPKRALWWSCPQDNVCAIPIIPKAWLDACDWKWSPEIFPFWFDDTWNQHIDLLIHGMPSLKVKVNFSGQRGKTTRGRDFRFWIEVFSALMPVRVQQAKDMAEKLGIAWQTRKDVLDYIETWEKSLTAGVDKLEEIFGDPNDPGPEYAVAKSKAEQMLAEMRAIQLDMAVINQSETQEAAE